MKRLLPLFFSLSVFLFFSFLLTHAQDFTFNRAFQDYLYNYNLYRTSHREYLSAKNEYQTYKTLNAQNKALQATREMLRKRAEAWRTYLLALRMKLRETTGILNYQQNLYYLKLDNEIQWLSSHKDSLSLPTSIEDLTQQSLLLEQRFPATEVLAYQTLGTILSGKQNSLREKVNSQAQKIEEKINQMKQEDKDVTKFESWREQARKKITASEEKQKEAEEILKGMKAEEREKRREFGEVQAIFEESNQYLQQAVSFLKEIIQEIKSLPND